MKLLLKIALISFFINFGLSAIISCTLIIIGDSDNITHACRIAGHWLMVNLLIIIIGVFFCLVKDLLEIET